MKKRRRKRRGMDKHKGKMKRVCKYVIPSDSLKNWLRLLTSPKLPLLSLPSDLRNGVYNRRELRRLSGDHKAEDRGEPKDRVRMNGPDLLT